MASPDVIPDGHMSANALSSQGDTFVKPDTHPIATDHYPTQRPTPGNKQKEVNTVSRPHIPVESPASPDDDPTGVRALLSGLPELALMPGYPVERINGSRTPPSPACREIFG